MFIFTIVWLGQLISLLGSGITNFALDVWTYQQTGSVTQLSFLILFTTMPMVIVSPFAGILVDHWNRRWVMILCDTGAAITTLTTVGLLATGHLEIWHIYLLSAVSSSFGTCQWAAYSAATTTLVPKKFLGRASGMTQISQALGQLLAPILAGVLLGAIHLGGIFVLDLGSFLIGLATLLLVRFPHHKVSTASQPSTTSLLSQSLYGLRYLKARSGLMALLLFLASSNFLVGIVQVLTYPLVLSFASEAQLGIIMSVGGIGMLVGSVLMSTWGSHRQQYIHILFCSMLLNGLSMIVAGLHPSILLFSTAAFLFFMGIPFINSCTQVIFQKKVAPEAQGRIFSCNNAIAGFSLPFAYLIAGPLADRIFEPLMATQGPLAESIGQLIGTGTGRGIGLMFMVLGGLNILFTIGAYQYAPLRLVEERLPDATTYQ
ncbi:MAG: MFS transporter [Cyanobacteria bacterium J06555_13]